jgi:hypothetical protein
MSMSDDVRYDVPFDPPEPARPLADPTETLTYEAVAFSDTDQVQMIHADIGRASRLDMKDAALETLALIAEFRLRITPCFGGWFADPYRFDQVPPVTMPLMGDTAIAPTIADAVRACVSRIRGQQ